MKMVQRSFGDKMWVGIYILSYITCTSNLQNLLYYLQKMWGTLFRKITNISLKYPILSWFPSCNAIQINVGQRIVNQSLYIVILPFVQVIYITGVRSFSLDPKVSLNLNEHLLLCPRECSLTIGITKGADPFALLD